MVDQCILKLISQITFSLAIFIDTLQYELPSSEMIFMILDFRNNDYLLNTFESIMYLYNLILKKVLKGYLHSLFSCCESVVLYMSEIIRLLYQ